MSSQRVASRPVQPAPRATASRTLARLPPGVLGSDGRGPEASCAAVRICAVRPRCGLRCQSGAGAADVGRDRLPGRRPVHLSLRMKDWPPPNPMPVSGCARICAMRLRNDSTVPVRACTPDAGRDCLRGHPPARLSLSLGTDCRRPRTAFAAAPECVRRVFDVVPGSLSGTRAPDAGRDLVSRAALGIDPGREEEAGGDAWQAGARREEAAWLTMQRRSSMAWGAMRHSTCLAGAPKATHSRLG